MLRDMLGGVGGMLERDHKMLWLVLPFFGSCLIFCVFVVVFCDVNVSWLLRFYSGRWDIIKRYFICSSLTNNNCIIIY